MMQRLYLCNVRDFKEDMVFSNLNAIMVTIPCQIPMRMLGAMEEVNLHSFPKCRLPSNVFNSLS